MMPAPRNWRKGPGARRPPSSGRESASDGVPIAGRIGTMSEPAVNETPYADLGPDLILDAVESLGLVTDGHLLALNSYENRVYQVGIEDAEPVIAKFYRPGRWSDDGILEEHGFTLELAEREIPAVPPSPPRAHPAPVRRLPLLREPPPRRAGPGAGGLRGAGDPGALHRAHPLVGASAALRPSPHPGHRGLRRGATGLPARGGLDPAP
jgi:hypothetical protein